MNAQLALVPADDSARFEAASPLRAVPPVAAERAIYGAARRPDPFAAGAALLAAGAAFASFLFIGGAPGHHKEHRLTVMQLLDMTPPPPPAPPEVQQTEKPVLQQPELVTPVPVVPSPAAPVMVAATEPPPAPAPVETVVAGPPAPAAPARPAATTDGGDLSSKMISATPPRYPIDSRRRHETGTVVLSVLLALDGKVRDVSVATSSGFESLDRAALGAVRHWRWSPSYRDGAPVLVRGLVTIPFVLRA